MPGSTRPLRYGPHTAHRWGAAELCLSKGLDAEGGEVRPHRRGHGVARVEGQAGHVLLHQPPPPPPLRRLELRWAAVPAPPPPSAPHWVATPPAERERGGGERRPAREGKGGEGPTPGRPSRRTWRRGRAHRCRSRGGTRHRSCTGNCRTAAQSTCRRRQPPCAGLATAAAAAAEGRAPCEVEEGRLAAGAAQEEELLLDAAAVHGHRALLRQPRHFVVQPPPVELLLLAAHPLLHQPPLHLQHCAESVPGRPVSSRPCKAARSHCLPAIYCM